MLFDTMFFYTLSEFILGMCYFPLNESCLPLKFYVLTAVSPKFINQRTKDKASRRRRVVIYLVSLISLLRYGILFYLK